MEFKPGNLSLNQCNNLGATWHLVLFLTVMPNATEQYQTAYQGERRKVNSCLKWEWSAKWKAKYCRSADCNLWACASFIVSWFISLLLCFSQLSSMWVQKHKTAIVDFKALIGFTEMLCCTIRPILPDTPLPLFSLCSLVLIFVLILIYLYISISTSSSHPFFYSACFCSTMTSVRAWTSTWRECGSVTLPARESQW